MTHRRWFHHRHLSPGDSSALIGLLETQRQCVNTFCKSARAPRSPAVVSHTVEITGVLLSLQLGYEFRFLPQEAIPVQAQEERVHLHLRGSTW